jgi:hypothetical protein
MRRYLKRAAETTPVNAHISIKEYIRPGQTTRRLPHNYTKLCILPTLLDVPDFTCKCLCAKPNCNVYLPFPLACTCIPAKAKAPSLRLATSHQPLHVARALTLITTSP